MEVRKIKGSENSSEWSGSQEVPGHIPCLSKVIKMLDQVAWNFIQSSLENLQGQIPHNLSEKPVLLPSSPHRENVSSYDFHFSLCLFSLFFLVNTTLKSFVNFLVNTGGILLGPMKPPLLQDEQAQLPQALFTGQVLQPSPLHSPEFS